jgi:hypothetical protein
MNDNNLKPDAVEMADIDCGALEITAKTIADAQNRENPDRYISPLRKGDIAIAPIKGQGVKALWEMLGVTDADCAKYTSRANIDKCRLTPDKSAIAIRKSGSQTVAAFNKWIIEVRNGGEWVRFSDFVRGVYQYLIPSSYNWKTANDIAFVIREGFIRRKGATAFVKVKKTATALATENAKLLEELRELKAELAKK